MPERHSVHAGLLVNGPPGKSRAAPRLVVRRHSVFRARGATPIAKVGSPNQRDHRAHPSNSNTILLIWWLHLNIMKTHGEIEAAVCEGMSRFEQDYMGRGPKHIHAHLIGDLLLVRLQGVLTAAEQHLVQTLPAEKGRDLLKQVRTHLVETARPLMEAMVREVTGVKVISLHHDISTSTGEEIVVFTLAASPDLREAKRKAEPARSGPSGSPPA